MKKRAKETVKNAAVLIAVAIAYYIFYRITDIGLKCPLHTLTGLLCPGCGITRMFTSLLNFDLAGALYYNAAVLLLLPFWCAVIISHYAEYIKNGDRILKTWHKVILIISIVLMAAYGILRNVFDLGLSPNLLFLGGIYNA